MTHPGHLLLVCFLLSGICAASDLPSQRTTGPAARTDSGVVESANSPDDPKLMFLRGIPYAAAPVGALRWKPPKALHDSRGLFRTVTLLSHKRLGIEILDSDR
jgi:hypothetical protein